MGVSSHTLRPRELAQDGSPFTEGGGRDQRVRGEIFTILLAVVLAVFLHRFNVTRFSVLSSLIIWLIDRKLLSNYFL